MAMNGCLEDRVLRIFRENLELDVDPDVDVFDVGAMDSMVFVRLLVELEREFGVTVKVDDLQLDDFRTVTRVTEFVDKRIVSNTSAVAGG
jgi:acyl carrier protein